MKACSSISIHKSTLLFVKCPVLCSSNQRVNNSPFSSATKLVQPIPRIFAMFLNFESQFSNEP